MTEKNRTDANCFYSFVEVLHEIDRLKFAFSSITSMFPPGSNEREIAENASKGIRYRLDWLHDAIRINAAKGKQ